jgi:hypothetical protein
MHGLEWLVVVGTLFLTTFLIVLTFIEINDRRDDE